VTYHLHELILDAAKVCENSDHTHTEVADVLDIKRNNHRRWRRESLRAEGEYQAHAKDEERTQALTEWLQSEPDANDSQAYSGPSDAKRDPQSVAAEGFGTGGYGQATPPEPDVNGATAETSFDPERAIEEQQRRFEEKHRRAQKKKTQTIRFDTGPIMLAMLGDQHIGNAGTNVKRIFAEQKTIKQTPGAYVWQMGDVVDNFIVGKLKEQNMKPAAPIWEQWQLAQEYMDRWGKRMVAFVGGNHGAWTMSETQIDYRRDICPDGVLYDGDDIRATVSVGSATYKVWARHKWRGHSIYNPTHGMERAMRFNDPNHDIYVGAHTHEGSMFREVVHEGRRKAAVQIGTYKRHDDHAREKGYPDSDGSTACALILHDDGSYHGMSDLDAAKRYMQAIYN
jgi:hypothetical protein